MAIYRTKKISNFTVVDNILIEDKTLTLKEKGLMLVLLRLPDNWKFSASGLAQIINESRNTTNRLLKSLEEKKYLLREPIYQKGQRGVKEWKYYIFETVATYEDYLDTNYLDINNLDINNLDIKSCTQINTNINKYENKQVHNIKTLVNFQKIIDEWNLLNLAQIKVLSTSRKGKLKTRLKEYPEETIINAIRKIKESDFLMGRGKNPWKATFDWLISNDKNILKILEGNYENNKRGSLVLESLKKEMEKER